MLLTVFVAIDCGEVAWPADREEDFLCCGGFPALTMLGRLGDSREKYFSEIAFREEMLVLRPSLERVGLRVSGEKYALGVLGPLRGVELYSVRDDKCLKS